MPRAKKELNPQDIWEMFAETDRRFKETEKRFKETEKLVKETTKQIQATDKKFNNLTLQSVAKIIFVGEYRLLA